MRDVIAALNEALERNEPVTMATVVDVQGASPAQVGFKLLVRPDGDAVGNVGGGELEQRAREEAIAALREGRSRLFHSTLREEGPDAVGTLCGGDVTFFIEVYNPIPTLLIVGGGHLGRPLAEMARITGFHVQIVDVQPERATVPQFDPAAITPWTYVVIISQSHLTDEQTLHQVLGTPAAYVGMIGSRCKVQTIFDHLRADGVPEERLAQVHAPIGLDLGGRSPEEIALAILAEVVQVRYGGSSHPRALLEQENWCHVGQRPFVSFPMCSKRGDESMSGQKPVGSRQSSCCGGDWRVKQIMIGGVTVGIIGLTEVLEQVYRPSRPPGPEAAEELLAMIKARNYVYRGGEEEYKEALLREYTAYWEAKAGTGRQGEKGR